MKMVKNKIFIIGALALLLAGCQQEQSDASKAVIQSKLPPGCLFKDFGSYTYPNGGGSRIVAVICKDAVTTTNQSWTSGKSTNYSNMTFDTRE